MNEKYSISVILPVYNEEGRLRQVIEDLANFLQNQVTFERYEIVVVDDGSKDNTSRVLREMDGRIPYLKIVTHGKNLGYGRTLMSGIKISQYPLVFFIDADGQFKIEGINGMCAYLDSYDIITGYRYKRKDVFYRVILGKFYSFLVFLLFGLRLKDINCGFKLFKREILNEESIRCKNGAFYTEVLLKAKNRGCRIKEVSVEHFPRLSGKATGASPKVIFNSIIDLIMLKYFFRRSKVRTFGNVRVENESRKISINRL